MEVFDLVNPSVILSFSKAFNNALVTGLSVTASIKNAKTNAVLLASAAMPESATGSGIYVYTWTHGLTQDTEVAVTYNYGTGKDFELIYFTTTSAGRAL